MDAAGRLITCVRPEKRRNTYAGLADWPDIGEHAKALETRTGFMRAFRICIAALASVRRGFRRGLVATGRLLAMRVHSLL